MQIGFCCKMVDPHPKRGFENIESCNFKTTTAKWIRDNPRAAPSKMEAILRHNLQAVRDLVHRVSKRTSNARMVRIGSDIFPLFTHRDAQWFWTQTEVLALAERQLSQVGNAARAAGVRLSMHPGQFVVLASESENVRANSVEEFEYHALVARMMGYCLADHDFKINVHLSGRGGVAAFRDTYSKLSPEARSCITIENDEFRAGLNAVLEIADLCPIVLDLHHHFIHSGEYIQPTDPRIQKVIASWRGVRPVVHYSQSSEQYLAHFPNTLPTLAELLQVAPRSKLRAHSDFYNHSQTNAWALQHIEWADIQAECKAKNLGADQLIAALA